ncbi:hypothetical protein DF153_18585 [Burkholderia cenocepacia]|nr:hypothetical protein DF152_20050 [Burkholderia cenocepacia]RQU23070.1 hypothetical protein DF153_18585 [Burkholderia cenocepacia]
MLVQPFDVHLDAVQRAQLLHQLVGERQQLRLKCADHQAVRLLELRRIDELPLLLGQRQELDLAIDDLGLRPFGDEIDSRTAGAAGRDLAQMPDVRDADLVDRRHAVIELDLVDEPRNGRLVKVEMVSDLLLSRHEYDPLWRLASREKTRVRAPAYGDARRVPACSKSRQTREIAPKSSCAPARP